MYTTYFWLWFANEGRKNQAYWQVAPEQEEPLLSTQQRSEQTAARVQVKDQLERPAPPAPPLPTSTRSPSSVSNTLGEDEERIEEEEEEARRARSVRERPGGPSCSNGCRELTDGR